MGFTRAVASVLARYAGFVGRARRSEYWWWVLFVVLLNIVATLLDDQLGLHVSSTRVWTVPFVGSAPVTGLLTLLVDLAVLVPSLAVTVRRLHDTGRSGWWLLLSLLCGFGTLVVLVLCLSDSEAAANRYGRDPKA